MGSEIKMKGGLAAVINTTAVETRSVAVALRDNPQLASVADALGAYAEATRLPMQPVGRRRRRLGGLLERDRWLTPDSAFAKMRLAREALRDDIVATAADGTEAFALSKIGMYADDEDEEDFWNAWAGDINLDDQLRKAWRILFTDSQFCAVTWWGRKDFKLPGRTAAGNQRRKIFTNMMVPIGMTFLDTTKVVPIGNLMFGQERLAYMPGPEEGLRIAQVLMNRDQPGAKALSTPGFMRYNGRIMRIPRVDPSQFPPSRTRSRDVAIPITMDAVELDDPLIQQLFVGRYTPDMEEARLLQEDGVDTSFLFEMRSDMAFRHCLTRPDFQRFAEVRLESIFELLDMKAQLRQLDRVTTIGGSHFIILITQGSDNVPSNQVEIDALKAQAFSIASMPVIVGPHTLKVEIITPKQDHTFKREKHDVADVRIFARVWSTFVTVGSDRDDPLKTAKVIAKNLESRRLMLRRTFEREIIDRIRQRNPDLSDRAKLVFTPQSISLNFDAAWASFLMDLRMSQDLSRNTILNQFDLSQEDEARMRKREKGSTDEVFGTLAAPGAKPVNGTEPQADPAANPGAAKTQQRAAGRRARGGGAAAGTGQGQEAARPRHKANPDTPKEAAKSMLEMDTDELLDIATDLEIVGRHKMRKPELRQEIRKARRARLAQMNDDLDAEEEEDADE